MNIFERRAAEIIAKWREASAANGGFTLELAEKLLADLLAEEGKTADANELHACRHERSLVAEELFLALTAIGIGPTRRHSPENVYSAEHLHWISTKISDVITEAGRSHAHERAADL